jgi:hypothetical protein
MLIPQPFCALCFVLNQPWHHKPASSDCFHPGICLKCYGHSIKDADCGPNLPVWHFSGSSDICYRCWTPRIHFNGLHFCQPFKKGDKTTAMDCTYRDIVKDLVLVVACYQAQMGLVRVTKKELLAFIGLDTAATTEEIVHRACQSHPKLPSFPIVTVAAYFIMVTVLPVSTEFPIMDYSVQSTSDNSLTKNSCVTIDTSAMPSNPKNCQQTAKCYACGTIGHFAKGCPQKKSACFKCGQTGHWAKSCLKLSPFGVVNNKEKQAHLV